MGSELEALLGELFEDDDEIVVLQGAFLVGPNTICCTYSFGGYSG